MMVVLKAIAMLPNADAETKAMGKDIFDGRINCWTAEHGHALVAATLEYAEAHWPFVTGGGEAEALAGHIETWSGKLALRRWWARQNAPPPFMSRPRETVPIG